MEGSACQAIEARDAAVASCGGLASCSRVATVLENSNPAADKSGREGRHKGRREARQSHIS